MSAVLPSFFILLFWGFLYFFYLFPLVLPIVSIFSNFASSLNSSLVLEPFNPTTLKYVANKDMKTSISFGIEVIRANLKLTF